jgi:hypothetical protein
MCDASGEDPHTMVGRPPVSFSFCSCLLGDQAYEAVGVFGAALPEKIVVFHASSRKLAPISPNASYSTFLADNVWGGQVFLRTLGHFKEFSRIYRPQISAFMTTLDAGPDPPGAFKWPYVSHSKSVSYGALCERAGRLTAQKRRFPARAVVFNADSIDARINDVFLKIKQTPHRYLLSG